ncbi:xylose isomerase [Planctomycetota bacterium]|nr:xylose isomerase [Planctomycetota bacterium]
MQLGYHTSGLQNHRLDEALRLLADRGVCVVALTPDVGHLDPFCSSAREVDAIAALLTQLKLTVVIETGARFVLDPQHKHEPTLMTRDAALRARRFDYYRRCAVLGRDLGARVVSFWSGIDHLPGPDSQQLLRDGVRITCAAIRDQGLVPSFEPEPGMAVATTAQWRQLRSDLGAEAPLLTLDIGHLYAEWEGEPLSVIPPLVPFLAQTHLEDMRRGIHEHLLPGTGEVSFSTVLNTLHDSGYRGPVCFELSRHSHMAPIAVDTCIRIWREVLSAARR